MPKANGDGREGREVLPGVAEHPAVMLLRFHALLDVLIEARRREAHEEVCALTVTARGGGTAPLEGRVHPLAPQGVLQPIGRQRWRSESPYRPFTSQM